jgi:hypothetical protein
MAIFNSYVSHYQRVVENMGLTHPHRGFYYEFQHEEVARGKMLRRLAGQGLGSRAAGS